MEHLHHPEQFLVEVERVLVRGGRIIATVPFMYHQHADPCDYWRPAASALRKMCEGFSSVVLESQGNRIHVISDLVTTIKLKNWPILFPLRIMNHLIMLGRTKGNARRGWSSAPSGFFIIAKK
jgi:hypothetical protein